MIVMGLPPLHLLPSLSGTQEVLLRLLRLYTWRAPVSIYRGFWFLSVPPMVAWKALSAVTKLALLALRMANLQLWFSLVREVLLNLSTPGAEQVNRPPAIMSIRGSCLMPVTPVVLRKVFADAALLL